MCTLEKCGNLFIITLIDDDHEHHLSPLLINSLLSTLSQVNTLITVTRASSSAMASTSLKANLPPASASTKWSNPLDQSLLPSSFPILTIVAVSGHAAIGRLVLTLGHDNVLMRRDHGFLYMSEVDLAMTLPDYFSALVRSKIGKSSARCDVLLRGMKVKGEEAVSMGIVDSSAHDSEESVVEAAMRLGDRLVERKWNGEVYAKIRKSLYPEICGVLGLVSKTIVASSKLR